MDGQPESRAWTKTESFRRETGVWVRIRAPPARLWKLLTTAEDFPRWNPTVTRIEGRIAPGERLRLQVPLAPGRTFKPKVSEFEAEQRMVWRDGMAPFFSGVRTFTLQAQGAETEFSMVEVLRGITLPMAASSLPDFGPAFEAYAQALKAEAEKGP